MNWIRLSILAFSLWASATLAHSRDDLEAHRQAYESRAHHYHGLTTGRLSAKIETNLVTGNGRSIRKGVRGELPRLDFDAILRGEKTLLSLGEGYSNFVYAHLRQQKDHNIPLSFFAVDLCFKNPGMVLDHYMLTPEELEIIEFHMANFPEHYVGAFFQEMEFGTAAEPLMFDAIVASNSLGYLISAHANPQFFERDKRLIESILRHLKPGGLLEFWPFLDNEHYGRRHDYLREILNQLIFKGAITNHNLHGENCEEWLEHPSSDVLRPFQFVIIQK